MTGAWQDIHGQATNYDVRALTVEHLFQLARAHGRSTALAAGAKTQAMFTPYVARGAVYEEEPETAPFNQYANALQRDLRTATRLLQDSRADLAQVELNLTDEAGHGWGSASPEYARAAQEVDDALRALAALVDFQRDTLVVTADHGHVATGGHGGPEPEVMQVPLVMAGRGVRAGTTGTCAQVDVAPTVAVLLGLPLPSANQGSPLLDALELTPEARREVLANLVAQREAFVRSFAQGLTTLEAGRTDTPSAGLRVSSPLAASPAGDEKALSQRLAALAAQAAGARETRVQEEAPPRGRRAVLVAAAPLALLGLLFWARAFSAREAARSAAFALAGVATYHLLLPVAGLSYSLTAVNKDEWLQRYFMTDMGLGLVICAVAVAVLCVWQRRLGADLFALCRQAWLCAAVFCTAFVLKVAFVYARHEVVPRWFLPDQYWGMAFYLDALVVMAVGLCAPALALIAGLVRLLPPARGRVVAPAPA
jgi:hypothetical protein